MNNFKTLAMNFVPFQIQILGQKHALAKFVIARVSETGKVVYCVSIQEAHRTTILAIFWDVLTEIT